MLWESILLGCFVLGWFVSRSIIRHKVRTVRIEHPSKLLRVGAVLGSGRCITYAGGHTSEMLALLGTLPPSEYAPFVYFVSSEDKYSAALARAFETRYRGSSHLGSHPLQGLIIPRARSVGQSWITTPFTLLRSLVFCIWHLGIVPIVSFLRSSEKLPIVDVLLMNGPATCVPVALVVYLFRVRSLLCTYPVARCSVAPSCLH